MNLDLGDAGMMPWLSISLGFIVLVHVLHTYLDVRQLKAMKRPEPPSELQGQPVASLSAAWQLHSLSWRSCIGRWFYL